jgi:putative addiction module component (TIGR02574 family)
VIVTASPACQGGGFGANLTATRLSPDERLTLIAQLWDSLDDHEVPLTTAQEAELEHRLSRLDQDKAQSVTWESLKAELEQRSP